MAQLHPEAMEVVREKLPLLSADQLAALTAFIESLLREGSQEEAWRKAAPLLSTPSLHAVWDDYPDAPE